MTPTTAATAAPGWPTTRTQTMKAVVKAAAAQGAEIRDVPVPVAGPGEVVLRVLRAGVCGTDLHIWSWDRWSQGRIKPPVTMGHEFVGEIVERGPGGTNLEPGERVTGESQLVCQV